jgi:hypothetical protein
VAVKAVSITITDEHGRPARLDDIRWQMNLPEFRSELIDASPVGIHDHDRDIDFDNPQTKHGRSLPRIPQEAGSLKRHWRLGNPGIRGLKVRGKTVGIHVDSRLPYARIVDVGGTVPPVSGRGMHYRNDAGTEVRTDTRGGYNITGHNYVDKAVDRFLGKIANVKVEWA